MRARGGYISSDLNRLVHACAQYDHGMTAQLNTCIDCLQTSCGCRQFWRRTILHILLPCGTLWRSVLVAEPPTRGPSTVQLPILEPDNFRNNPIYSVSSVGVYSDMTPCCIVVWYACICILRFICIFNAGSWWLNLETSFPSGRPKRACPTLLLLPRSSVHHNPLSNLPA
jgi:hypothetical protein